MTWQSHLQFFSKSLSTPGVLPTHALAIFLLAAIPSARLPCLLHVGTNRFSLLAMQSELIPSDQAISQPRPSVTHQVRPKTRDHISNSNPKIEYPPPFRPFDTLFELPLLDGLCLGVNLPTEASSDALLPLDELHALEVERLAYMQPHRQVSFVGGRVAMRRAIEAVGSVELAEFPLLFDDSGAPTVASSILGSISHTDGMAVGFAHPVESFGEECIAHNSIHNPDVEHAANARCAVGVDVENALRPINLKLAKRTLATDERQTLGVLTGFTKSSDLLLRISIKEALYKALYPLVKRAIRWHSVLIQPNYDGTCMVNATELEKEIDGTIVATASWRLYNGYFLSVATAILKPGT